MNKYFFFFVVLPFFLVSCNANGSNDQETKDNIEIDSIKTSFYNDVLIFGHYNGDICDEAGALFSRQSIPSEDNSVSVPIPSINFDHSFQMPLKNFFHPADVCYARMYEKKEGQLVLSNKIHKIEIPDVTAIDLGLPSGTKWAACNLGASRPDQPGYFFSWGEVTPKNYYSKSNYKFYNDQGLLTKYIVEDPFNQSNRGHYDNLETLEREDDAAQKMWNRKWRIPTPEECDELISECEEELLYGVHGIRFTGPNGNSLFFPYAGVVMNDRLRNKGKSLYYWTSSLKTVNGLSGFAKIFSLEFGFMSDCLSRDYGLPIRPVCE